MLPAHPDTIPGLAPDCRRVLRDDYQRIQVACQRRPRSRTVVTYQFAYVAGTVDLCDSCAADPATQDDIGVLGQVSHGEHRGECRQCAATQRRRVATAVAEYKRVASLWGVEVGQ